MHTEVMSGFSVGETGVIGIIISAALGRSMKESMSWEVTAL
jgi:hypothetical protein